MLEIAEKINLEVFGGVEFKVQHYDYSAFGKILSITDGNGNDVTDAPPVAQSFAFTGREWDVESGLYFYRARFYDANIGRFLQEDPDAGRLSAPITHINKYAYVGNNPISRIDPSGMSFLGNSGLSIAVGLFTGSTIIGGLTQLYQRDPKQFMRAALATAIIGGAILSGAWAPVLIGAVIGGGIGYYTGGKNATAFFRGALTGAIAGGVVGIAGVALGGTTLGMMGSIGVGASVGAIGAMASTYVVDGKVNWKTVAVSTISGGLFGMVGNYIKGDDWFSKLTRGANDSNGAAADGVGNAAASGSSGHSGGTTHRPSYP